MAEPLDYLHKEAMERSFECKRRNFVTDYGVTEKPSLIIQCMPAQTLRVDVESSFLRKALEAGSPSEDGWWHGFRSGGVCSPVFDGVSTTWQHRELYGWTTEIHEDGHLLAGIWTFPEVDVKGSGPCQAVAPFHAEAFNDFGRIAASVLAQARFAGGLLITSTLRYANRLASADRRGRHVAAPLQRETLRWPIAETSLERLPDTCKAMGDRLLRAYGVRAL